MPTRRSLISSAAGAATLAGAGRVGAQSAPSTSAPLDAAFARVAGQLLDRSPETATSLGLDTGPRAREKWRLADRSLQGRADDKAANRRWLAEIRAAAPSASSPADRVNLASVLYGLELQARFDRAFDYPGPGAPYVLSQLNGAYQSTPDFLDSQHAIASKDDADAYLARMAGYAGAMDQELECARHDGGLGVTAPDFALDKMRAQLKAQRDTPPDRSPLVQSLVRRAAQAKLAGDWSTPATAIYESQVRPALDRQIAWVDEARPKATHDAGVWRLPHGAEYYALSLQGGASTTLAPSEIHATGLQLVAELGARADAILRSQGMTQGAVGQRLRALFDDPRQRYPDTDAGKAKLIADLNVKVQAVQAKLPQYFGVLPKATVVIKRVPKAIEAGAPGGYYQNASLDGSRPGAFYINLRNTAEVPAWTLPTLVFHESIPGHHLQISIQQEASLPLLRKIGGYNAYVEGWALYAEQLAEEMGMYEHDPLGRVGYLHDAMLRAVRLVIDTGVHDQRWTRERAVAYYTDTLGDPDSGAITEVERYCVWPGQACGYMVGKLDWLRNRARARTALGARFDIRRFHDAGLTAGAMPLSTLDTVIDRYIATG
ncbi:MAG: DUF885 family protein [Caulobacteraceae bacterium]|nr:DUF885 family protein [Caulobacter sp.]